MKRLLLTTALVMLATTASHALDNSPQECAQFKDKPSWFEDGTIECENMGVKAYVKEQRKYDQLAKQGKLCGEYWNGKFCKRKN